MKKTVDYTTLGAKNIPTLDAAVVKYLLLGWELYCEPRVINGASYVYHMQTMIKKEDDGVINEVDEQTRVVKV